MDKALRQRGASGRWGTPAGGDLRLAERIRSLRTERGLTQQELALRSRLSVSIVARLDQGRARDPRLSTAEALAGALGVPVADLIEPPAAADVG